MKRYFKDICILFIIAFSIIACDTKPRVIEAKSEPASIPSNENPHNEDGYLNEKPTLREHKVEVEEVLNSSNYTYLNVREEEKQYWIAISKSAVKVGDVIYYRGGLLQENFKSKDLDRVFETLYLVSTITNEPFASTQQKPNDDIHSKIGSSKMDIIEVGDIQPVKGAITLSELFSNKEKYKDQVVKITGKCVKVNNMIMNRNWVHIKDGSGDGLDLTVTTQEEITLGKVITLEGKIAIEKDFGAGYHYGIIMEEAVLK